MASRPAEPQTAQAPPQPQRRTGMSEAETRYMRGERQPAAGSVPMSTSRFLNSPLFAHAFTQKALRRYGHDVAPTYDIPDMSRGLADVADLAAGMAGLAEEKANNPAFRAFLERRVATIYDPDTMDHHAAGTLGAAIRDFIRNSGYDINFVNKGAETAQDLEYLRKRIGDCHDIEHIVTGFGPNPAGENALALMNVTANALRFNPKLAHFLSMPNIFVTAAAYARTGFNYPVGLPIHLKAMEKGIAAGRSIRMPLAMVVWEDYLDWQLEDIAGDLGFERGPGDAWKVSEELCLG